MKKIMILGASALQLPIILLAKKRGLYVITVDYNPDAVGIKYADEALVISTVDKEEVYKQVLRIEPDYVITSTSDMPVLTVAYVNELLKTPCDISYADSFCATNKSYMRNRLKECGVPIPQFYVVNSDEEYLATVEHFDGDFIVKPADNAASRGVCLGNKKEKGLLSFYAYSKANSRSGVVLVEEFMHGKEVSVESFTLNKNTEVITITDKITTGVPHFVEVGHSEPSEFSAKMQDRIGKVAKAAIKAINVINGPTHTEICITEEGPKVVELAARLGGDFIASKLVPLSMGVDLIESSLNLATGLPVDLTKKASRASAIMFIPTREGIIKAINGIEDAEKYAGVEEVSIYHEAGDTVGNVKSSSDRIGHVIATATTPSKARAIATDAMNLIKVEYE